MIDDVVIHTLVLRARLAAVRSHLLLKLALLDRVIGPFGPCASLGPVVTLLLPSGPQPAGWVPARQCWLAAMG
jgi:hypothetical protein